MRTRKLIKGKKAWEKDPIIALMQEYARYYDGKYIINYKGELLSAKTPAGLRQELEKKMC
jgi:hypothetical protein